MSRVYLYDEINNEDRLEKTSSDGSKGLWR
jgi:hypothetical protein